MVKSNVPIPDPKGVPPRALQRYLEEISDSQELDLEERRIGALRQYAELNFHIHGGGHCDVCRAHVRHEIAVIAQQNGSSRQYRCLCTRCFEAERATCESLILYLGSVQVKFHRRERPNQARPWHNNKLSDIA